MTTTMTTADLVEEYLRSAFHRAPGKQVVFKDFFEGIRTTYPEHKKLLERGPVLGVLGPRVIQVGRKDQPRSILDSYAWGQSRAVHIDEKLARRISAQFFKLVQYRWQILPGADDTDDDDFRKHVVERPDYSRERYSIAYEEIPARITDLKITAETAQAAMLWFRENEREVINNAKNGYNMEERLLCYGEQIDPITDTGVINYRWLGADEERAQHITYPFWLETR